MMSEHQIGVQACALGGESEVLLGIEGMTCGSCVKSIESRVSERSGVKSVDVDLRSAEGLVLFTPGTIDAEQICMVVKEIGFNAEVKWVRNATVSARSAMASCTLAIEGMTCQSCVRSVHEKLTSLAGVETVRVSLEDNQAVVVHSAEIQANKLREAIDDIGFEAQIVDVNVRSSPPVVCVLRVVGMTCQSCVRTIEEVLGKRDGVQEVHVSLEDGLARVQIDQAKISQEEVRDAVDNMGFEASLELEDNQPPIKGKSRNCSAWHE